MGWSGAMELQPYCQYTGAQVWGRLAAAYMVKAAAQATSWSSAHQLTCHYRPPATAGIAHQLTSHVTVAASVTCRQLQLRLHHVTNYTAFVKAGVTCHS